MAVDEQARLALARRLEDTLGDDEAATLMALLSDDRLAHLATRQDLTDLEQRLGRRFEQIDRRFERAGQRLDERLAQTENRLMAAFRGELLEAIARQTRAVALSLAGTVAALAAVMIGVS